MKDALIQCWKQRHLATDQGRHYYVVHGDLYTVNNQALHVVHAGDYYAVNRNTYTLANNEDMYISTVNRDIYAHHS